MQKFIKMFFTKDFIIFVVIGIVNTFNGSAFSYLYSLFITNVNVAFIVGYISSLAIAYLLNSFFLFKAKLDFKKFIKFAISYIPNFIIQNVVVFLMYNTLGFDKLIAFIVAAIIGIPVTFLLVKLFAFGKSVKK